MAEETKIEATESTGKTRRSFVTTAAQVAVTAPAVGLLLNATAAKADILPVYVAIQNHVLDDFTYGNTEEDIDGAKGFNYTQDDVFQGPA